MREHSSGAHAVHHRRWLCGLERGVPRALSRFGGGNYTVVGTINNAKYQSRSTRRLVIGQATGAVTLGSLSQTYDGTAKPATATTTPSGLTVTFSYNGSATIPTGAGSYTVVGTINDANY